MANFKKLLFLVIFLLISIEKSNGFLPVIVPFEIMGHILAVKDVGSLIFSSSDSTEQDFKILKSGVAQLERMIAKFDNYFKNSLSQQKLTETFIAANHQLIKLHRIKEEIGLIDTYYSDVMEYRELMKEPINRKDLNDTLIWAMAATHGAVSPEPLPKAAYSLYRHSKLHLIELIAKLKLPEHRCSSDGNTNQGKLQLALLRPAVTLSKAIVATVYAWELLGHCGGRQTDYLGNLKERDEEFRKNLGDLINIFKNGIRELSNDFCRCNPAPYEVGEVKTVKTVIVDECMSGIDEDEKTCPNGVISGCSKLFTEGYYCTKTKNNTVLIDFVEDAVDHRTWGQGGCIQDDKDERYKKLPHKEIAIAVPGTIPGGYGYAPPHKTRVYCMCACRNVPDPSTTFITLPIRANVTANRVITGVRIVQTGFGWIPQIQEGVLKPNGEIDNGTVEWQKINMDQAKSQLLKSSLTLGYVPGILLGNLQLPEGYVLTGLNFVSVTGDLSYGIEGTKFNYKTGKLEESVEPKKVAVNPKRKWSRQDLLHFTIPDGLDTKHLLSTLHDGEGKYLYFTTSDEKQDFGQTTIPFLDLQEVSPFPRVPLTGVGFYYKTPPTTTGYLGTKVLLMDYLLAGDVQYQPQTVEQNQFYTDDDFPCSNSSLIRP